jgi:hypothetical protein
MARILVTLISFLGVSCSSRAPAVPRHPDTDGDRGAARVLSRGEGPIRDKAGNVIAVVQRSSKGYEVPTAGALAKAADQLATEHGK